MLQIADVQAPEPERRARSSSQSPRRAINPVDWLVRDGGAKSFVKVKFPVILGCDLAGASREGAGVTRWKIGDEVFAMMPHDWGAHAERVALPADLVVKNPGELSGWPRRPPADRRDDRAQRAEETPDVRAGERVLVNGARARRQAAVQIAKVLGAGKVTAMCSKEWLELVEASAPTRSSTTRPGLHAGTARWTSCSIASATNRTASAQACSTAGASTSRPCPA